MRYMVRYAVRYIERRIVRFVLGGAASVVGLAAVLGIKFDVANWLRQSRVDELIRHVLGGLGWRM